MKFGNFLLLLCGVTGVLLQIVQCKKEKHNLADEFQALFDSIQTKVQFSDDGSNSHSDSSKNVASASQAATAAVAGSQNSGQDAVVSGSGNQASGQQPESAVQQSSQKAAVGNSSGQPAAQVAVAPTAGSPAPSDQSDSPDASSDAQNPDTQAAAAPQAASDSYGQRPVSPVKQQEQQSAPAVQKSGKAAVVVLGNSGSQAEATTAAPQQAVNSTQTPATAKPAATVPSTPVQPVPATEKRQQSNGGRSAVIASSANDNDSDDLTSDRAGDLQPDMFRVFLQMSQGLMPKGCQVDADCASQKGAVCSRFLNKCVAASSSSAVNSNSKIASNCGPQVCNVDSDCCSGEKCDSYGGLLSRKRCRKAETDAATSQNASVSTGALSSNVPASRSLSGSNNAKNSAVPQDSSNISNQNNADNSSGNAPVQSTAGLPSKSGSPQTSTEQSQSSDASVDNSNLNQQTSFASRGVAATGSNVDLQSGVSVSSNAGVGSKISHASNSVSGSDDVSNQVQNSQNQIQQQEQDGNDQAPADPAPAKLPEIPLASSPAIQSALAAAKAKTSGSSSNVGATQPKAKVVQSQASNGQGVQSSGQEPAVLQAAQSRSLYPGLPVRVKQTAAVVPANY